jgi:ATP synthase protein I
LVASGERPVANKKKARQNKHARGEEAVLMAAGSAPEKHAVPATDGSGKAGAAEAALPVGFWLKTQLLAAAALALLLGLLGLTAAVSSLLGSMAAFLPAVFFAVYVGRKIGASSAAFLQAAVTGEALKLLLTAVICVAVFRWVDSLAPEWFFAGMILVMVAGWIGLYRGMT